MKNLLLIVYLFFALVSCVDKYKPELEPAPENIVVEGSITNMVEPYTVTLKRLTNVNDMYGEALPGATVTVSDGNGNSYPFIEKSTGVYQSDPNVFTGIIGKKYVLNIKTKDGQVLQSSEETMLDCPKLASIDNVYRDASAGTLGFYVFVGFKDLPEAGNYYRWETTYYPSRPRCGEINSCCEECWYVRKKPEDIIISSDENYNGRFIQNQQVYIVPYESRSNAFINIVQYSTTANTYEFWKQLRKQLSNVGSIFDPTPTTITGNIENLTNKKERVFGLFSVESKVITPYIIKRDYITENPNFEILPPIPSGPPPPCMPCIEAINITKKKPFGWPN